ncbi:MAG: hypothetical protein CVU34_05160 [Betaproteobacteria bacterium HGW-Betaproteobacteria-7]|jgi:hypothetical protein|nr:MAG: hypothetical protein CVU34_05160 [Betaproteobacteria bacterium HGW-Betaproteobacteria-7]
MDRSLIYAKTPVGDEAVRQRTRVVQRNLRMVLLQVDGSLSVDDLIAKIGNQRLVETALKELEDGGFIAVSSAAEGREKVRSPSPGESFSGFSVVSEFSTFGPKSGAPSVIPVSSQVAASFSTFGKPMLAAPNGQSQLPPASNEQAKVRLSRPGGWGGWLLGAGGLLLLALIALLLFYPYGNFRPAIEASLSQLFAAPVRVGSVSLQVLPKPKLLLSDVVIGERGESRIATVAVDAPYVLLGKGPYRIDSVTLSAAVLAADRLVDLRLFGARPEQTGDLSIRRIEVEKLTVMLGDLAVPELSGDVIVRNDGTAEKAVFRTVDGSLRLLAVPSPQGILLTADGLSWKPEGSSVNFESLQAMGLLQKNRLLVQRLDTTFLGGILKGNWLVDWSAGMVMAGEASLARLDTRKVSSLLAPALRLEGELSGSLRMRATGTGWHDMLAGIEASLDAEMSRGLLTGIDVGEVARRGSGAIVRSGATRFDTLAARLDIGGGRVVVRSIELDAGLMTAKGQLTVEADGRVDGVLSVQARSSVSRIVVPARLSGTLGEMTVVADN